MLIYMNLNFIREVSFNHYFKLVVNPCGDELRPPSQAFSTSSTGMNIRRFHVTKFCKLSFYECIILRNKPVPVKQGMVKQVRDYRAKG